jgi:hypothetical protein
MKLFKLIASKAGQVVFDDRIEAQSPREAREQMKNVLGLNSLTGVVYSITEIPVELIREIVAAKVLEVSQPRRGGQPALDVTRIVADAANTAVAERLRPLEQRLAALEAGGGNSTPGRRFDAFSGQTSRTNARDTAAPEPAAEAPPEPATPRTDWRAVKKFYKQTRSPKQTAARFDLPINTVKARVRREGW